MKQNVAAGDEQRYSANRRLTHSFRDPAGSLIEINGRLLRMLTPAGEKDARAFLEGSHAVADRPMPPL